MVIGTVPERHEEARRAGEVLRAVLPASAEMRVLGARGPIIEVKLAGRRLRVAWAGEGWIRQIRALLAGGRPHPDVIAARRMSPGAKAALAPEGIGWVDELGNAEISIGSLIVSRTGRGEAVSPASPKWTPAVMAIAEALLCGTAGTVAATEAASGLSTGSCTNALGTLTELGLLARDAARGRGSARRVVEGDALLDAYATAATTLAPKERLAVGVTWRDPIAGLVDLGRGWEAFGIEWAATGAAGRAVLAPLLTNVTSAVVYVNATTIAELEMAARKVDLEPIEGGRLTLRPFPTVSVRRLAEPVDGLRVAPWPRVYVDLRGTGVRGEEAAEHLREVRRGP